MKTKLKNQIIDLLNVKTNREKLIFLEGEYFVHRGKKLQKISDDEALKLVPDSEVLAFFLSKKEWYGSDQKEDPPELLKGKKVQRITVDSTETAETYLNLRDNQ